MRPKKGAVFHPRAFVLEGQLTTVNTVGNIDQLTADDCYAFSAGSGCKHCELNLRHEDTNIIYVWMMPDLLLLPPSYDRARYEAVSDRNRIVPLVGKADGALRVSQDIPYLAHLNGPPPL